MRAGKLRHRVEIQADAGATQDSFGAETASWTTSETIWANVEPLSGQELERAQQVAAEVTHQVTCRYRSTLTRKNRIKFGTRYFDINAVMNAGERNIEQRLLCKEAV